MKGIIFFRANEENYKIAENKFDSFLAGYDALGISIIKFIKNKNEYSAIFANGDRWDLVLFRENIRGRKANLVYAPHDVTPEEQSILKCCAQALPYADIIYY